GTLFDGQAGPYVTTSTTVSVTFGTLGNGISGYSLCVFPFNGCGPGITKCVWIRGALSGPGVITGSRVACPNNSDTYSIPSIGGADTYTWTPTGGISITGGNGSTS